MADWRYWVGILLLVLGAGTPAEGSAFRRLAALRYLVILQVYNDKGPSGLAVQVRNLDGLVKFRRPD